MDSELDKFRWKTFGPLVDQGLIERGFMYALGQRNMFQPMPWVHIVPAVERRIRRKEWNDYIDDYIRDHAQKYGDYRSAEEIAIQCKISEDGDALYKKCGNPKCTQYSTDDVPFKRCSVCKITKYCSPECQKLDWNAHKGPCKRGEVKPYLLKTQQVMEDCINMMVPSQVSQETLKKAEQYGLIKN
jgi:hypothetical protein